MEQMAGKKDGKAMGIEGYVALKFGWLSWM
jgi:hypothetical protein